MMNTFHVKTSIISWSWFLDKCASNFTTSNQNHFCWSFSSSLHFLSLFLSTILPLLFFLPLLSLGAGWWILNPCGVLGGGLLFQIAWQNLNHHHQSQNLAQNHPLFFTFSHFSSSSSSSSIYPTNHTLLPWPPGKAPKHQNQPCLPQPCTLRIATNPVLHLLRMLLEENLELRLMKFQVVQTLYQINR